MTVLTHDPSVPRPPQIDLDAADLPDLTRRSAMSALDLVRLVLGFLFYAVGWLAGAVGVPIVRGIRWVIAAIALGWEDASDDWAINRERE